LAKDSAMQIYFRCSRCRKLLCIGLKMAGMPITCPLCRGEVIVPSGSEPLGPVTPQAGPLAPPTPACPVPIPAAAAVASAGVPVVPRGTRRWSWPSDRRVALAGAAAGLLAAALVTAHLRSGRQAPVPGHPSPTPADEVAAAVEQRALTSATGDELLALAEREEDPADERPPSAADSHARLQASFRPAPERTPGGSSGLRMGVLPDDDATRPVGEREAVKRRRHWSEAELRAQLAKMPEVGLERRLFSDLIWNYRASLQRDAVATNHLTFDPSFLVGIYPGVATMPLRYGKACRLDRKAAGMLDTLSRKLRVYVAQFTPHGPGKRSDPQKLAHVLRNELRGKQPEWLRAGAIPALMQQLTPEDERLRLMLVALLAEVSDRQASLALANRAAFDLSPDVRGAAIDALKDRPRSEYRQVFLRALRYPWAPAADHAAEALVALNDRAAVPMLVRMLREPDPSAPVSVGGHKAVREVVRVNHLANCLMCHPPSVTYQDPVPGVVPAVSWQFPAASSTQALSLTNSMNALTSRTTSTGTTSQTGCHNYTATSSTSSVNIGPHGTGTATQSVTVTVSTPGSRRTFTVTRTLTLAERPELRKTKQPSLTTVSLPLLVRGDVTYLRQDFSVPQPVAQPAGPSPLPMRFDYLVRTRPLSSEEARQLVPADRADYEQRQAVLFALRELTGLDAGLRTASWEAIFPNAGLEARTAELSDRLVQAAPARRSGLLDEFRTGKGPVYTQALARAIPRLPEAARAEARAALVARLRRLSAATVQAEMRDENAEVRRAAAVACLAKGAQECVPDLVELLKDPEPAVVEAAHNTLRRLSGQDFGPEPGGDADERARAAEAWIEWQERQDRS
jgi:HEAT repeat protein